MHIKRTNFAQRYLRYLELGLRLLFPSPVQWRYRQLIRRSGLFDRDWYRTSNPRLPRLCKWLPEGHYVLVGEAAGLCPSPSFSPRAYSHLNPSAAATGLPPFAHYITFGQSEGRAAREQPAGKNAPYFAPIAAQDFPPAHQIAVVLHLYYREMWPAFSARLAQQNFEFDLFVTLCEQPQDQISPPAIFQQIQQDFPKARIWTLPNHGRDILPFLHLAQSGLLSPYRALCKLHSKASPHRQDGALWRDALLEGILGDPHRTVARLEAFLAQENAGIWVANGHIHHGKDWIGPNGPRLRELAKSAGIVPDFTDLRFAGGSIFWLSDRLLAQLAALDLRPEDFELEMGQVDGTTAHALERLIGLIAQQNGLSLLNAQELDPALPMR